jgi:membrane protein implicated in regulation of membrane protease activity
MINEWWTGLDFSLQIFYGIGIFALFLLVLQSLLLLITGGDEGGDIDFDPGTTGSYFSFKGLTALAMGFGWTGVICIKAGLSPALAAVIGAVVGIGIEAAFLLLMAQVSRLQTDGTFKTESAVGCFGTVYVTVPPKNSGAGEVVIKTGTRSVHIRAFSDVEQPLRNGAEIEVVGLRGTAVLVKPVGGGEEAAPVQGNAASS